MTSYYDQLCLKLANQLLSKFQLTPSSAVTDDIAYFDITISEDEDNVILTLTPNGSFCLGTIIISLKDLQELSKKYDACDKEYFLLELCGGLYNRI